MDKEQQDFENFLSAWTEDPCNAKPVLERFRQLLLSLEGISLVYHCRPGVSYSILIMNCCVWLIDKAGKPIPGLYGAGCVVGGANGADSMTTLMNTWAIVSGYVAGESAAKNAK